jgi:hypothetical protein
VMTPGFFKTGVDARKKKAGTPQDPGQVDALKRVAGKLTSLRSRVPISANLI